MKLHWFDRILMFVIACCLLAAAVLAAALPLSTVADAAAACVGNLPYDSTAQIMLWGGAAILLLLSIYLFANSLHKKRKPAPVNRVTVRNGDIGQVEISLSALDTLIQKCVRGFGAVRDCTNVMNVNPSGELSVQLKLSLLPDADLPELSQQVQSEVKDYVQKHAGVTVRQITILVESTGVTQGRVQ